MTTQIEQLDFDYRSIALDDRGFVKERALRIHDMARKTAEAIRLIGQWLSEVKERLPHGAWLPWLDSEFGWTDRTARRFMAVHDAVKLDNLSDLNIDVSALYKISAPSTPEPVRQEVIHRAQSGERITHAKAVEVLASYEKREEIPTPAVARQIAIATGIPTLSTNHTYVLPMSKADEEAAVIEQTKIRSLYSAIELLVNAHITPQQMIALGRKHDCRFLFPWSVQAGQWLLAIAEEAKQDELET